MILPGIGQLNFSAKYKMEDILESRARNVIYKLCLHRLGPGPLDGSSESKFLTCAEEIHDKIPKLFSDIKFPDQEKNDWMENFKPLHSIEFPE